MRTAIICALLSGMSVFALGQKNTVTPPSGAKSLVITFKDGHQQTFSAADVARVEFSTASAPDQYPGRFRGKWKVGTGAGDATFYITLDNHGNATKSFGASHGTWTVVGEEARIIVGRWLARCDPQSWKEIREGRIRARQVVFGFSFQRDGSRKHFAELTTYLNFF